ncbi:DsbA family protein [Paracoccus suum]|uniref:DsbA family protein n=1 Tax=Paracoccus suum TaxID=2259340 RepID=A0A344PJE4_9RHOB|nr:DsbA family protein [Paracoccus suum]AXC49499.1 DsbA family protein [Paracoccus suum]
MKRLALAVLLTAATALPAAAFDPAAMSEQEREAFGQAVREYLMANPEVLIESINVLEERRAADESKDDRLLVQHFQDELLEDGHSWVGGNPSGDLTMVEFVDYRCGVCRQVFASVEDLVKSDGNIRIIYKDLPILGQDSDTAARFAIAVKQTAGDEAYKKAHDKLMTMRGNVTLDALSKLAAEIGVDPKPVIDAMNTEAVTAVIRANLQLAEKMKIAGTPTFVVGPELLRGVPHGGLEPVVEAVRKGAKAG